MKKFNKNYYEQSGIWQNDYVHLPAEVERINETINAIPRAIRTIFDVGCGNGFFINTLSSRFPERFERIVGLDVRVKGLECVQTDKIMGSIHALPFESESFDLVTCLETLEHLSLVGFPQGIAEIQRVSRKYIMISVPNDEILENSFVTCPNCSCAFHRNHHVRRFNKDTLNSLFSDFNPVFIREIGPVRYYLKENKFFFFLRFVFIKKKYPPNSICPQCGYENENNNSTRRTNMPGNHIYYKKLFSLINPIVKIKKKRWLLVLYSKNNT
jgi:SAM-dependent methyltransferase